MIKNYLIRSEQTRDIDIELRCENNSGYNNNVPQTIGLNIIREIPNRPTQNQNSQSNKKRNKKKRKNNKK